MRYYDITITDPKTGKVVIPTSMQGTLENTTYSNFSKAGNILAGGLDVDIDIVNRNVANYAGGVVDQSRVRIYGVSIEEISQAFRLNEFDIVVKAGMQKGLPLAKAKQSGVIGIGRIWGSVGNWEGIDKTLDLYIYAGDTKPANFQFLWRKGTSLKEAIAATLATAAPQFRVSMHISPDLKSYSDKALQYTTFEAFASAIAQMTKNPLYGGIKTITGKPYAGVEITKRPKPSFTVAQNPTSTQTGVAPNPLPGLNPQNEEILVNDFTETYQDQRTAQSPLLLEIEDFIGQPSWLAGENSTTIRFKTVMRSDIHISDFVIFPKTKLGPFSILNPADAFSKRFPQRNELAFQTSFIVKSVRHQGRLRNPHASGWVSIFEAGFTNVNPPFGPTGIAP